MPESAPATAWTCDRCSVTATWMPGVEAPSIPPNWSDEHGGLLCLGCRRELAGETGVAELPEDAPAEDRRKQHTHSRIEFEIQLHPDRPDQQIAKACRTSIVAVRRTRERLGIPRVDASAQGS